MISYSARSVYAALFLVFLGGVSLGLYGRLVWRQDQAIVRAAKEPAPCFDAPGTTTVPGQIPCGFLILPTDRWTDSATGTFIAIGMEAPPPSQYARQCVADDAHGTLSWVLCEDPFRPFVARVPSSMLLAP